VARAPEDQPWSVVEDVGVTTCSQKRPWSFHSPENRARLAFTRLRVTARSRFPETAATPQDLVQGLDQDR
jgi:hypothetical protein